MDNKIEVETKLRCAIIDDEPLARRGLARLVEADGRLELSGTAENTESARNLLLQDPEIELLLLDIDMPGESGMDFAKSIVGEKMIIFTTAYTSFALESYEVEALDYLLKPISAERFVRSVEKAIRCKGIGKETPPEWIEVKADRRMMRIILEDILYIEGLKDYLIIHLENRRVVTRMTMKSMEEALRTTHFLRVNKSYIVNRNKIEAYDSANIRVGEKEIPVGGIYREAVRSIGRLR